MKNLLALGAAALILASACSQPSQQTTVQCPPDSQCDVNITPPPMSPQEIQYHADQRDMADDVLMALMIQDMAYRNCWNCYGSYYSRYPNLQTQATTIQSLPPQQRYTAIQKNSTTVIQNNTTVIQQASAKAPSSVKAQSAPNATSGQNSGTGGGNAATNKSASTTSSSSSNGVTKPSAPSAPSTSNISNSRPSAPAPAPSKR